MVILGTKPSKSKIISKFMSPSLKHAHRKWLTHHRAQCLSPSLVNYFCSERSNISTGVPQGLTTSLSLFNIFTLTLLDKIPKA